MRICLSSYSFLLLLIYAQAQTGIPKPDPIIEKKITEKLASMSLDEKIGQMILLEVNMVSDQEGVYSIWQLTQMSNENLTTLIKKYGLEKDYSPEKMKAVPKNTDETKNYLVWYGLSQALQANSKFKLSTGSLTNVFKNFKVGGLLNAIRLQAQTPEVWHNAVKEIQEYAIKYTGIPMVYGIDQMHGGTYTAGSTLFPQQINMGATFNRELAYKMGEITAYETRACSLPWCYAPLLDLGRHQTWSRIYETFGEDPYLAGVLGAKVIQGLQGNDPNHIDKYHMAACLKHYFGYGIPNSGLDRTPTFIDNQNLREKQYAPFLDGFNVGALSTMTNSSTVNGMNGVANKKFLTQWLKKDLNWDGLIVTDWGDLENIRNRDHIAATQKDAILMGVNAGVDMIMVPSQLGYGAKLKELVSEGKVSQERIDDAVSRILRLKYRLNLFEQPYTDLKDYPNFGSKEHVATALKAAEESMVLLKNDNNILPLPKGKKIFVCGPNANSMRTLDGGWSYTWQGDNTESFTKNYHTILNAIQNKFGKSNVSYQAGVQYKIGSQWNEDEMVQLQQIIAAAKKADYIIVCVGENSYAESTGNITDLNLSNNQKQLVKALQKTGRPIVMLLNEGRPRLMYDITAHTNAIVAMMLPGNYGGDAIANLLSGDANFSGKLSFTYPLQPNALTNYDYKAGEQNITLTGTFDYAYKFKASYQWAFGTGLSYTNFQYSNLKINKKEFTADDNLECAVDVKNTGKLKGKESVLLYSSDHYASLMPDNKRLRAFEKIELQPGETKTVSFSIPASALAFVNADDKWMLEEGNFTFAVGTEKTDIKCTKTKEWDEPNIPAK